MDASLDLRFRRRFRGYETQAVDDAIDALVRERDELSARTDQLHADVESAQSDAADARHDLARAKAELRYWNDRASYVDSEVARARRVAIELERDARTRAESIEADAQERSIQLIDRVCSEANQMLVAAREEARDMFLRFETEVDVSQQKLDQLEDARQRIAHALQNAMTQFSDAMRQMEQVSPPALLVETLEQPSRRTLPTFGRERALAAAARFDAEIAEANAAALSSPLRAQVEDVSDGNSEGDTPADTVTVSAEERRELVETAPVETEPLEPTSERREHEPDAEFAALLIQP